MKPTALPTLPKYDNSLYLMRRLFNGFMRPYLKKILAAMVLMVIVALCVVAQAKLIEPTIDKIFLNKDSQMLYWIVGAVVVIALIHGAAAYGQSFIMRCLGQKIVIDMQLALYRHILGSDLAYFGKDASGKIISRFTNDIQLLRMSVSTVMVGIIKELLTFVGLVGVMFYQDITLSLVVLIFFPFGIYPILKLGRKMRKVAHGIQEELGSFTVRLDESFKGIRVIKAYQQEQAEVQRAETMLGKLYKLYVKAARIQAASSPIMEILGGVAFASVIWYGGSQVIAGGTTPGKFFSFLGAVLMAYRPLKVVSSLSTGLQEGLASARRLFMLLDEPPLVVNMQNAMPVHFGKESVIKFHDVHFQYAPKKPALQGVELMVQAGKKIALVGPSGGGKSTIMNLMLRFYDPDQGTITIDNHQIKHATIESLRQHMAVVSQEVFLFDGTVAQNIAYGKPGASQTDIVRAATAAAADEFIQELPNKYETMVGEGGLTLSGGQRQRIAIARAILKDAPILLLDEATSALDPISERKIQTALNHLMEGRTSLVIAHRLSTVMNADIIYVLKKGKVVESGSHVELLANAGEYSRLYKGLEE
jgi:ATP-binding cassette, subfamily B, bacterial MsbA